MKKLEAWPELMGAYFKGVLHREMAWGEFDCCLMAADCVLAMTGEDFAADFRGTYDDGPSAFTALMRFSGTGDIYDTMKILAERHGWEKVEPLRAQRGDIAMVPPVLCGGDDRFGGALGICTGPVTLMVGQDGIKGISTIPNPGQIGLTHVWRIKSGRD